MSEGLGTIWAERRQPIDEREALIEVKMFLSRDQELMKKLPTRAEIDAKYPDDDVFARCIITRESHLEYVRSSAVSTIDHYLSREPARWYPGMWKPTLPWFIERPVRWRAQFKCEDGCGAPGLEIHHLHYRSVGKEVPSDLLLLCRKCHHARHMLGGAFFADPEDRQDWLNKLRRARSA